MLAGARAWPASSHSTPALARLPECGRGPFVGSLHTGLEVSTRQTQERSDAESALRHSSESPVLRNDSPPAISDVQWTTNPMSQVIGIDLGTTNSLVAYMH